MKRARTNQGINTAPEWLIGGDETAELIRSLDWSATPLGPRADWPQVLKTVVNIILSSNFSMAILWGKELIFIYNNAYRVMAGDRHPHAMGRSTQEIWPEAWAFNKPVFEKVLREGKSFHFEDQLFRITRNHEMEDAYFTLSYSPIWMEAGSVGGSLVTLIETTKRVQSEHRLRESERRFRAIFDQAPMGIAVIDSHTGRFIQINQKYCDILGYTMSEVLKMDFQTITHPDDLQKDLDNMALLRHGAVRHFSMDKRYQRKDGTIISVTLTVTPLWSAGQAPSYHLAMVDDVTERKHTERDLQESEERLAFAFRAAQEGVWDWNMETGAVWYSREYKKMLGYEDEEIESHVSSWLLLLHPEDKERALQVVDSVMRGERQYEMEFRLRHKDGHYLDILSRGYPIRRSADGPVVRIVGTHFDLTGRKKMERDLLDKTNSLQDMNTALKVLIDHYKNDQKDLEDRMVTNIRSRILPYLDKLKVTRLDLAQSTLLEIIESSFREIASPFSKAIYASHFNFTPKEMDLINLIKEGKTTKEIAKILNIGTRTVEGHRNNIRKKLDIKNKDANLRTYLSSLNLT